MAGASAIMGQPVSQDDPGNAGPKHRGLGSERSAHSAAVWSTVISVVALVVSGYTAWDNAQDDSIKRATVYFSDYVKFVRELEAEPAKNRRAITECLTDAEPAPPTAACVKLTGPPFATSAAARCGSPADAASSHAAASARTHPEYPASSAAADGRADEAMFASGNPPMTSNSISYVMHLAESILVAQRKEPGWRTTVAGMVCDNAQSIARANDWRCTAMDTDFVRLAKVHSLLCCADELPAHCEQRRAAALPAAVRP